MPSNADWVRIASGAGRLTGTVLLSAFGAGDLAKVINPLVEQGTEAAIASGGLESPEDKAREQAALRDEYGKVASQSAATKETSKP